MPRLGLAGGGYPGRQPGGPDQAPGADGPVPVRPGGEFPQLAAHARREGRARSAIRSRADRRRWDEQTVQILSNLEARDDLVRRLEEEFDLELLEAATQIVRDRVAPKTWEAYHLTARKGCPAPDVAARLGMRVGTVYQAKSSVTRMLQEEVRKLEAGERTRDAD